MTSRQSRSSTKPVRAVDPVAIVREGLHPIGDPARARQMAAYLKTDQPLFGVAEPNRRPIYKQLAEQCPPANATEYRATVLTLWTAGRWPDPVSPDRGHRDYRWAACAFAERFAEYHVPAHLPLLKRLVAEGAWWDLVDWVATRILAPTVRDHHDRCMPVMHQWISDESMWVRRAAILSQVRHKDRTDARVLFDFCLRCADEKEFFIRKAIGWALREYAASDAAQVTAFLVANRERLSPLSFREAAKHLDPALLAKRGGVRTRPLKADRSDTRPTGDRPPRKVARVK